ncbi:MAG: DUF2586 family protein [Bacteroidales bacterium]
MSLPYVKIDFSNGALGQVALGADGVFVILATGAVVADKFALNTAYTIKSFKTVTTDLGITSVNNPGLYKLLNEFYAEAGDGTEVWLKAFADTVTMTEMITLATANGVQDLLTLANGRMRGVIVHRTPASGYTPTITAGLDADVTTAIAAAQVTGLFATNTLKAPVFVLVAGLCYSGVPADLVALNTGSSNRVGVFIGDSVTGNGCGIGLLAGRVARVPVQRNVGRVKDGAILGLTTAYLKDKKVEVADPESIHDKGYMTIRTHVGRSGYFFSDNPLATVISDDYNQLTARRTVDKAYRVAYDTLLNELSDEVPVTDAGKISPTYAKSIETKVENAIINTMTINGNLGRDPGNPKDNGVTCFVNTDQNIVATGVLKITVRVKPYGYAKYIEVELGFKTLA